MRNPIEERKNDDRLLYWLQLRMNEVNARDIADAHGCASAYVRAATNRVVRDDAKHHADKITFPKVMR